MECSTKGVKLLGFWASPFAHRVRWALKLKGVEYEYIEEDIFNKTPLLSQLNPVHSKVPVLVHNGKPLLESIIILEYVDETWKNNPLLPVDPHERAEARFWAKYFDDELIVSAWLALCSEGEIQENAVMSAKKALKNFEDKLKGKKFFGGNKIGYLDLTIGPITYLLPVWEELSSFKIFDPLDFPAIAAWRTEFLNHALVKSEYLPSKAMMIPYFQLSLERLIPRYAAHGYQPPTKRRLQ